MANHLAACHLISPAPSSWASPTNFSILSWALVYHCSILQGSTEAAPSAKLQPDSQCQRVHSRLFPEVDSKLSTAAAMSSPADHRQPAQLADKPVPLPTPLGSSGSGSDAAHIHIAAASAAEGQAQLGIGSISFAVTSDSSGRHSTSFDQSVGMQAAQGQPSAQQRTATYPRLAPSLKGMPHMSPAAIMYVGAPGLPVEFSTRLPGLQPPPPPPPARHSHISRCVGPQAGHMHAFTSQRQGRLLLYPQHAARANSHHQFQLQPDFQQRPARHTEVRQSLGERGHSINSLGRRARPVRSSLRATHSTSGSSQLGRSSNPTSSTSSLQSSATGKQPVCRLYTGVGIVRQTLSKLHWPCTCGMLTVTRFSVDGYRTLRMLSYNTQQCISMLTVSSHWCRSVPG